MNFFLKSDPCVIIVQAKHLVSSPVCFPGKGRLLQGSEGKDLLAIIIRKCFWLKYVVCLSVMG